MLFLFEASLGEKRVQSSYHKVNLLSSCDFLVIFNSEVPVADIKLTPEQEAEASKWGVHTYKKALEDLAKHPLSIDVTSLTPPKDNVALYRAWVMMTRDRSGPFFKLDHA